MEARDDQLGCARVRAHTVPVLAHTHHVCSHAKLFGAKVIDGGCWNDDDEGDDEEQEQEAMLALLR